ncbi:MAG: T9SS type A sorting domain-containing protein [Bacteroidetes bacterium]|nr:T9SS type A sorting domain-containing protein [Bacteroidota bacterium]
MSTNSPTTWAWDFGDGGTSTLQNPSHSYPGPGQYQVCLTVTNVCGTDSACHATDVLAGMSQVQTMRFTVYPNPNTGIFTVSAMLNGMDDIEFTLWDLNGNSVWKTSLTAQNGPLQSQIDVRPFATGLYFLEIKQGGSREFHKIVLEK